MTQAVADTLRRAKARIDTLEKWCQGAYEDPAGRKCALGAIGLGGGKAQKARQALHAIVGFDPINVWNDAPGRTHAEVMAVFDAAIAAEERKPGWYWATVADGSGTPIEVQTSLGHNPIYGWHGITDYRLPVGLTLGPRIEDLLRDAEQYRWLRDHEFQVPPTSRLHAGRYLSPVSPETYLATSAEFDAEVDAEIAREKADQQRKMLAERLANRQKPAVIAKDYGIPILDESDPAREKETP